MPVTNVESPIAAKPLPSLGNSILRDVACGEYQGDSTALSIVSNISSLTLADQVVACEKLATGKELSGWDWFSLGESFFSLTPPAIFLKVTLSLAPVAIAYRVIEKGKDAVSFKLRERALIKQLLDTNNIMLGFNGVVYNTDKWEKLNVSSATLAEWEEILKAEKRLWEALDLRRNAYSSYITTRSAINAIAGIDKALARFKHTTATRAAIENRFHNLDSKIVESIKETAIAEHRAQQLEHVVAIRGYLTQLEKAAKNGGITEIRMGHAIYLRRRLENVNINNIDKLNLEHLTEPLRVVRQSARKVGLVTSKELKILTELKYLSKLLDEAASNGHVSKKEADNFAASAVKKWLELEELRNNKHDYYGVWGSSGFQQKLGQGIKRGMESALKKVAPDIDFNNSERVEQLMIENSMDVFPYIRPIAGFIDDMGKAGHLSLVSNSFKNQYEGYNIVVNAVKIGMRNTKNGEVPTRLDFKNGLSFMDTTNYSSAKPNPQRWYEMLANTRKQDSCVSAITTLAVDNTLKDLVTVVCHEGILTGITGVLLVEDGQKPGKQYKSLSQEVRDKIIWMTRSEFTVTVNKARTMKRD